MWHIEMGQWMLIFENNFQLIEIYKSDVYPWENKVLCDE